MLDIIRATAAPRVVMVAGLPYLVSPPSNRMKGLLAAELEARSDSIRPADCGPDWRPVLGGRASLEYFTGSGLYLIFYATTRRDHPSITLADAADLCLAIDPDDIAVVLEIAILDRRARSFEDDDSPPDPEPIDLDEQGSSGCVESIDFGEIINHPSLRRFPPQVIAEMTFDQMWSVVQGRASETDRHGSPLTMDEACREIEEFRRKAEQSSGGGGDES